MWYTLYGPEEGDGTMTFSVILSDNTVVKLPVTPWYNTRDQQWYQKKLDIYIDEDRPFQVGLNYTINDISTIYLLMAYFMSLFSLCGCN